MKKFLLGLAVGAATVYVASKLIDDETKDEFYSKLNQAADEAKYKMRVGKIKAKRAGMYAKRDLLSKKEKVARAAGDLVDKVSDDLHEIEGKLRDKANKFNS